MVRVRSSDAPVTAFFSEGESLSFSVADKGGSFPALVTIDYIAGSAWWTNRYELDLDRQQLAMVARVRWQAQVLFDDVDLLLVSGTVHSAPRPDVYQDGPPPPAAAGSSALDSSWFSFATSSPGSTRNLDTFTVPASQDAGIYVVHRAQGVDLPGAAGKDAKACREAGFSVRVYESPIEAQEYVAATFSGTQASATATGAGLPALMSLGNAGTIPWVPGRVELWKDSVLIGSDHVPYTPAGGKALMHTGTSFDVSVSRSVESTNATQYVNYTLRNVDAVPHRFELRESGGFENATLAAPFERDGKDLVAQVEVEAQGVVVIGFRASP
jgi:hypothetical protein